MHASGSGRNTGIDRIGNKAYLCNFSAPLGDALETEKVKHIPDPNVSFMIDNVVIIVQAANDRSSFYQG